MAEDKSPAGRDVSAAWPSSYSSRDSALKIGIARLARSGSAAGRVRIDSLSSCEKAALAAGFAIAHGFLVHIWWHPSGFDALGYVLSARDIAANGLFSKFYGSHMRTYGYPAFLVAVDGLANALRVPFQIVLLEVQLLLHVAAALFVRRALVDLYPTAARIVFCGLLANYYAMLYATESLAESLSLTLMLLAVGSWLRLWRGRDPDLWLMAGSLIVGLAVMVRPANVFMVAAWAFGCALLWVRHRVSMPQMLVRAMAVLAAMSLPALPQIVNNAIHHGTATPLVAHELGRLQHLWGVKFIKYATAMPPVPHSSILYPNPLIDGTSIDEQRPLDWYFDYPVRGLATLALHTFSLTDQDLTFSYARDLDPWYRWPLGALNHGVVALGLVGLLLFARRVLAARSVAQGEALVALSALLGANLAIYSLTAVEMRFGLTLLLALFPLAGYAVVEIVASKSGRPRLAALAFALAYVSSALLLSDWVRSQSPQIREAPAVKRALDAPPVFSCPTSFDFASPPRGEGWSAPEPQAGGGFSMWMAADRASMTLPVGCEGPVQITLSVASYMAEDIVQGLKLKLDGTEVPLARTIGPDGRLQLNGRGPSLSGNRRVRIDLSVPRTIVPPGGNRTLAVMFRRLEIAPADGKAAN